jgi:Xaa-Pro aminopeptidase
MGNIHQFYIYDCVFNSTDLTFEQEAIIGIVQLIQETCIKMCTPEYSLNQIYRKMMAVIEEYIQALGFMDTKLEGQVNGVRSELSLYCQTFCV